MINPQFKNLTKEQALGAILHYEKETERLLAEGKMTQWEAWESYFRLMYECNLWEFWEDRERSVSKIDQTKFNPFLSTKPEVILIARDICACQNIKTRLDN